MTHIASDFYQNIALGTYTNISSWGKIGYTPTMATTDNDVWSYGNTQPVYVFPASAAGMEIKGNHADDTGTVIKGNAQGASAIKCDASGTTTTLIDADVTFTAATAVAVGDLLIVEASGTTPEWGYITGVDTNTLTFSGGLSKGGSCATAREYSVVDASPVIGALAVLIEYLDGSYVTKYEIVIMNGTGVVPTVNTDLFRINGMRVIGTGTNTGYISRPTGAIQLRHLNDTPVYTNITALFTRARNSVYTVPAGKTLYVTSFACGFGISGGTKFEICRFWTRANVEPSTGFNTGSLFFPYTGVVCPTGEIVRDFPVPTKLSEKTDIRISGQATAAGVGSSALRGFLTTP